MVKDFSAFDVTDVTYKTVDGHDVGLSIFTAKGLKAGTYPLIVRFHGGFLVSGSRNSADWFAGWLAEYVEKTPCIMISADYRLLPEANGVDLRSDIADLFTWIHTKLAPTLSSRGLEPDLSRILTFGESAGGYMAVQAALLHPDKGIKAVISMYGVLDIKTRFFTEAYEKGIFGAPSADTKPLTDHLEALREGKLPKVVSNANPPERFPITLPIIEQGRLTEFLGSESESYPMENLDRAKEPIPIWLVHGKEDSAVPVEGSLAFAEKFKSLHPDSDMLPSVEPGEHGFDAEATLDTPWVKKGMEFISKHWA